MIENFFVCGYAIAIALGCMSTFFAIKGDTKHLSTWKARRTQASLAQIHYRTVAIVHGLLSAALYAGGLNNIATLILVGGAISVIQTGIVRPYAAAWTKELDNVEHMFKHLEA